MLIGTSIRLSRILKNTWQVDIVMIISCTIAYLAHRFLIRHHFDIPAIIPTVLGTAIAFFIGFNNNQAYDRWWEARKIWGALVNDSRSWARGVLNYVASDDMDPQEVTAIQKRMICRHLAFLYALKGALRSIPDTVYKKYLTAEDLAEVEKHANIHNAILNIQSRDLQAVSKMGLVDDFRFLQLDSTLVKFSDEMGMSERIKNTVFPTTYNYLTKVFIWLFVVFIALVTSDSVGVWSIFLSWMVGFVFVSTQINGMSLIDPFSNEAVSIPLSQITRTIEINLLQMMGEENVPEPIKPVNNEYVL